MLHTDFTKKAAQKAAFFRKIQIKLINNYEKNFKLLY
jgi:hypothetical protein